MSRSNSGRLLPIICCILVLLISVATAQEYKFSTCKKTLQAILDGNHELNGINNNTVDEYLWHGPIAGLKPGAKRNITALTYKGCLAICGDHTELRSPRSALEIAATWIFPLSIILNLPYDSFHQRKVRKTFATVLNWIGSPQTALSHTIFNVRQIRQCHRIAKTRSYGIWNDAFYVLSCLGQFETPINEAEAAIFYRALTYGLFRPLSPQDGPTSRDQIYAIELLSSIAFQLRMLRRRGVIPTLSSLAVFLIAFIFSIVIAFGEIAESRTGSPLTLGLLFSWLPLLVIFTVIDRNPVSADRTATLISRWLYNVNAVIETTDDMQEPPEPKWWTPRVRKEMKPYYVGEFIGQGRRIKYFGLVEAVIRTEAYGQLGSSIEEYETCAQDIKRILNKRRPTSWFVTAIVSLLLVWTEILMAFMVAFFTPTFGLGCWTGSLIFWGFLSSLPWIYHVFVKSPGPNGRMVCHAFNLASVLWIIILTGFVLTGGFKNCYCSTATLDPRIGGYMMFQDFDFYVTNFNMESPWIIASAVGGFVLGAVLITAILWWMKCQHLWSTEEREPVRSIMLANLEVQADTVWLGA